MPEDEIGERIALARMEGGDLPGRVQHEHLAVEIAALLAGETVAAGKARPVGRIRSSGRRPGGGRSNAGRLSNDEVEPTRRRARSNVTSTPRSSWARALIELRKTYSALLALASNRVRAKIPARDLKVFRHDRRSQRRDLSTRATRRPPKLSSVIPLRWMLTWRSWRRCSSARPRRRPVQHAHPPDCRSSEGRRRARPRSRRDHRAPASRQACIRRCLRLKSKPEAVASQLAVQRRGIQPGRLNRYSTIRGGMLNAWAIAPSSFDSPARIDASCLPRTLESHSGSTTTARPTATRSAPISIAPSASMQVLIPPLAMTAARPAMTRANSAIGARYRGVAARLDRTLVGPGLSHRSAQAESRRAK